jgi:hypothetical protein
MDKIRKILAVILMLYIITGIFIILYNLLLLHSFSRHFGYTLLVALLLLKGTLIGLRCNRAEQKLTQTDRSKMIFLFHLSLILFCLLVFISLMLKGQQIAAFISLLALVLVLYCTRADNTLTNTNP